MTVRLLEGNALDVLKTLPEGSVQCGVTSPPYWGLRDYGNAPTPWPAITYSPLPGLPACVEIPAMECALGLEPTLEAFIGHMVQIFREARRVLRDDGTVWMNMGDSYAGSRSGPDTGSTLQGSRHNQNEAKVAKRSMTASRRRDNEPIPRSDVQVPGLKPKDMVGQPWRLALALQADGWWLRQDIIWDKRNPMPEAMKDRCTKSHEYVFLLAKSERYYFDHAAIAEPSSPESHARYARGRSDDHKHAGQALVPGSKPNTISQSFEHMAKRTQAKSSGWATGTPGRRHDELVGRYSTTPKAALASSGALDGAYAEGKSERLGRGAGYRVKNNASMDNAIREQLPTRNKRSVWRLSTKGFSGAHFATFPPELVEPCILAGSRPGDIVIDWFGGSGTVGLVADRLQRDAVLIELNPAYAEIARSRITTDAPLFASVTE